MFGIDSAELLIIALVALVVIGPKDLPGVMRAVGQWIGRARGMARHFRAGIDTMMRESEIEEMEKKWKADNEKIMRDHPSPVPAEEWAEPVPALDGADADVAAPPEPKASARPKAPPRRRAAPPLPAGPAAPPAGGRP